jgi:hypothetical protein
MEVSASGDYDVRPHAFSLTGIAQEGDLRLGAAVLA